MKVAVVPVTFTARFDGGPGGVDGCPNATLTPTDSGPVPLAFEARTLRMNVPSGAVTLSDVAAPTGAVATTRTFVLPSRHQCVAGRRGAPHSSPRPTEG